MLFVIFVIFYWSLNELIDVFGCFRIEFLFFWFVNWKVRKFKDVFFIIKRK